MDQKEFQSPENDVEEFECCTNARTKEIIKGSLEALRPGSVDRHAYHTAKEILVPVKQLQIKGMRYLQHNKLILKIEKVQKWELF